MIRFAAISDSPALLNIYSQYIDTPITFEYTLPTREEFAERIRTISQAYPYLVWEENGSIAGYAYGHKHKERETYQWNAELSIYLDRSHTSKGLGTKLYTALMEILKLQGVRTVYGFVTVPNEKSEGLHRSMGFCQSGLSRNTGYKCNAWHDVACFEKALAPYGSNPAPVLPIGKIPRERLEQILRMENEPVR